jgi:hypothetical protein
LVVLHHVVRSSERQHEQTPIAPFAPVLALEKKSFGGAGMHESECACVKHRADCVDLRARIVANVQAFAHQRMAVGPA